MDYPFTPLAWKQIGTATMENSMGSLEELKIVLPYYPAIPLGHILGEKHDWKRYKHPSIQCNTEIGQDMEVTLMFIDRGMDKEYMVEICNETILDH